MASLLERLTDVRNWKRMMPGGSRRHAGGYGGEELRAVRKIKGVGRPPVIGARGMQADHVNDMAKGARCYGGKIVSWRYRELHLILTPPARWVKAWKRAERTFWLMGDAVYSTAQFRKSNQRKGAV